MTQIIPPFTASKISENYCKIKILPEAYTVSGSIFIAIHAHWSYRDNRVFQDF